MAEHESLVREWWSVKKYIEKHTATLIARDVKVRPTERPYYAGFPNFTAEKGTLP